MDESSGSTVVEAKKLYTQQLIDLLTPSIYDGLNSIYNSSKEEDNVLKSFQEKLCSVVRWNQDIIDKEYSRITRNSDESYLTGLIDAVFVSNVKVLSSIRISNNKNVNIKVPDSKVFIHKAYVECARQFYQDPYLMDDRVEILSQSEIQRNVKRSKNIIGISIEKTIRDLIPVQEIIESYLSDIGLDDVKENFEEDIAVANTVEVNEDEEKEEVKDNESSHTFDSDNADVESNGDEDFFMKEPSEGQVPSQEFGGNPEFSSQDRDIPDLEVTSGENISETPGGYIGDTIHKKIVVDGESSRAPEQHARQVYDEANFFSDSD
jgi:hypothetical protein